MYIHILIGWFESSLFKMKFIGFNLKSGVIWGFDPKRGCPIGRNLLEIWARFLFIRIFLKEVPLDPRKKSPVRTLHNLYTKTIFVGFEMVFMVHSRYPIPLNV